MDDFIERFNNRKKTKGSKPKTSKKATTVDDDNLPPLFYDPILNAPSDVLLKKSKESSVQFSYSIPILGGTSNSGMLNKRLSEIANMLADTIKREKREKK